MYMYIHIYIYTYIIYYIIYLIHIAHVSLDMDEIWWHKRSEMATGQITGDSACPKKLVVGQKSHEKSWEWSPVSAIFFGEC